MAQRFDVRRFRDTHGLSAQRVADALGVHLRTVQRWDAGDADPSPMALKALRDLKTRHDDAADDTRDTRDSHDDEPAPTATSNVSAKPRRPALLPSIG